MVKVQRSLLNDDHIENEKTNLQSKLFETIVYITGFPWMQEEAIAGVVKQKALIAGLADDDEDKERQERILKMEEDNVEANQVKLERHLEYLEYFQGKVIDMNTLLNSSDDIDVTEKGVTWS